uniref:PET domain-containing protein n=1 Tax=Angiostrongylus cantonensis TaxID=6313 RepID=A0A0K0D6C2_ANGCA
MTSYLIILACKASPLSRTRMQVYIRVKFARLETERQKKRREASALYREKLIASDSWIPMEVHLKEEPLVEEKLTQMTPLPFNESKNFEELTTRDLVERGIICDEREQM